MSLPCSHRWLGTLKRLARAQGWPQSGCLGVYGLRIEGLLPMAVDFLCPSIAGAAGAEAHTRVSSLNGPLFQESCRQGADTPGWPAGRWGGLFLGGRGQAGMEARINPSSYVHGTGKAGLADQCSPLAILPTRCCCAVLCVCLAVSMYRLV